MPTLHDYQIVARDFLRNNPRAALMLDMGLGKTAATLSALEPRHLPALVVAPPRVATDVWPTETVLWRPDLTCTPATGSPSARASVLGESRADLVTVSSHSLADAVPHAGRFRTIIIDELSQYKNRDTSRWKAARQLAGIRFERGRLALRPDAPHVWGLTGTPAPNGLLDLWPQMALLDAGARLGRTLTAYRERFFVAGNQLPSGVVTEWRLREGADGVIHSKLDDIALSMKAEGRIRLPPVTHNTVRVPMPPKVRAVYRELKRDLMLGVDLLGVELEPMTGAALGSRLSQLSAGFLYHEGVFSGEGEWTDVHKEKATAVANICEETGSPVLVLYRFRAELASLKRALPHTATLAEPDVLSRWNAGTVPVLLAHPASIGHGLNLQHGGHTAVWASPTWSLEEWEQANRRLARQGQKHPVVIHRVQMDHSIDAPIYAALEAKTSVQDALLDHLASPL